MGFTLYTYFMPKRLALVVLFVVAGFLRLANLGYSDYQGDEIKALYNPKEATSAQFFLEQRKGPMQFLITAGLKGISNEYHNRALARLPFALAGLGSVLVFYYLAKSLFNQKIALYATMFFATNGFLIAFSRLVQYQSLVIFFGLLAVYFTKKYADSRKPPHPDAVPKYLVLAGISLATSILSHYDGVFFVPIILGILFPLVQLSLREISFARSTIATESLLRAKRSNPVLKHLIISTSIFLTLTCVFYIPFALNIAQSTTDYWAGRISGDVSGKISSSRYLFSVYQPIYVLHIYTILGIIGFAFITLFTFSKIFSRLCCKLLAHVYKIDIFNGVHAPFSLSIPISVLAWFLIPFILLEVFIYIPGTHIYAYLIPVFLFMGFALFHADLIGSKVFTVIASLSPSLRGVQRRSNLVIIFGIWLLFAFLTLQSYYVFVDHKYEYPWENKKFLIWTLPKPTPIFHLSIFGFPYFRHWDNIGEYIKSDNKSQFYTTNERVSISRYHTDLEKAGEKVGYYIYIKNPQTFTDQVTNIRINAWMQGNPPIVQYKNQDRVVSEIYLVTSMVP